MLDKLKVGGDVIYVDPYGVQHAALVTAVWGAVDNPENPPCINVVYVSSDDSKQDSYGRQMERQTSLVNKRYQPAHGNYYMMPGETPNPVAELQS